MRLKIIKKAAKRGNINGIRDIGRQSGSEGDQLSNIYRT